MKILSIQHDDTCRPGTGAILRQMTHATAEVSIYDCTEGIRTVFNLSLSSTLIQDIRRMPSNP